MSVKEFNQALDMIRPAPDSVDRALAAVKANSTPKYIAHFRRLAIVAAVAVLTLVLAVTAIALTAGEDLPAPEAAGSSSAASVPAESIPERVLDYNSAFAEYTRDGYDVSVKYVEPLETPNVVDGFWEVNNDWSITENCDLVVKAVVRYNDEVCIDYSIDDGEEVMALQEYGSLITLDVTKVYYKSDKVEQAPESLTAYSIVSTHQMFEEDGKLPEPGTEYYFFLESSADLPYPLGYDRICDYMITLAPFKDYLLAADEPVNKNIGKMLAYNFKEAGKDPKHFSGEYYLEDALDYLF